MDQPGARSPAELDITDRPATAAPTAHPVPELPELDPTPPAPAALSQPAARGRDSGRGTRVGRTPGESAPRDGGVPALRPPTARSRGRGPQVVFTSARDGSESELYVMAADGSDVRRLTDNDVPEWDPAPSPDGRWIAFGSEHGSGRGGLYVIRPDGTQRTLVTSRVCRDDAVATCTFGWPAWSPDGRYIAYTLGMPLEGCEVTDDCASVWVVGADGSAPRRLATGWGPAWSPDGTRLAYADYPATQTAAECTRRFADSCDGRLFVVDVASGAITDLGITGVEPAFSPVAPMLAFARQENPGSGAYRIVVRNLRSGVEEVVTDELASADIAAAPEFSRDGSHLLYTSWRGTDQECDPCTDFSDYDWDIYTMDVATRVERRLTDAPRGDRGPGWLYP